MRKRWKNIFFTKNSLCISSFIYCFIKLEITVSQEKVGKLEIEMKI